MSEREPIMDEPIPDPYWSEDLLLGETRIDRETSLLRLKLHVADEPYRGRTAADLVPLTHRTGVAIYLHGQPYILEPAITLAVDLNRTPNTAGTVGRVGSTSWDGMRHRPIGNTQAWYYPADRLLVLWECFLEDRYRQDNPLSDRALQAVWTGFEDLLRVRFPAARQIITPSWEDLYEKVDWQHFLGSHGYSPSTPRSFSKQLASV